MNDQPAPTWIDLVKALDIQHCAGIFGTDRELRAFDRKPGADLIDWQSPLSPQDLRYTQLLFAEACDDWEIPTLTGYTHDEFRQGFREFQTAYPENA